MDKKNKLKCFLGQDKEAVKGEIQQIEPKLEYEKRPMAHMCLNFWCWNKIALLWKIIGTGFGMSHTSHQSK